MPNRPCWSNWRNDLIDYLTQIYNAKELNGKQPWERFLTATDAESRGYGKEHPLPKAKQVLGVPGANKSDAY